MTTLPQEPEGPPPVPPADATETTTAPTDTSAVLAEAAAVVQAAEDRQPGTLGDLDRSRRMLLVHAHPDDETINNGVTMARYAGDGATVTLVTCTLGEEGEVLVPGLAHLAARVEDGLGQHRVGELATAMEALGVTDHRFLGGPGRWRDSGMMGEATNERPDAFWQADLDEAAGELVEVLREVRPQVLVTYDEDGGYGHPDHIQAHRVALRALDLAADPSYGVGEPWAVSKVYYPCTPESRMREALRALRESADATAFEGLDPEGELPSFVVPDAEVTTRVDGAGYVDRKIAAMRAHATQIAVDGPFFALADNLGQAVWENEYYRIARGLVGERGDDGLETDLFSGVADARTGLAPDG